MALVGVCGATTWGTTLAMLIANNGHTVQLLARSDDEADALNSDGENRRFAPGVRFPADLRTTSSPDVAFRAADLAIIAVPSQTFRSNVQRIAGAIQPPTVVVSATKGLEVGTGKRMSQILREELDPKLSPTVCALSGPNLAREINEGKHSSTVIASDSTEAAAKAQELTNTARFRVYTSNDLIGVECAGALKNVVALGAGVCDGLKLGDNAKAAFLTRGLAEITRLGAAMGANPMTFAGLAGMGRLNRHRRGWPQPQPSGRQAPSRGQDAGPDTRRNGQHRRGSGDNTGSAGTWADARRGDAHRPSGARRPVR